MLKPREYYDSFSRSCKRIPKSLPSASSKNRQTSLPAFPNNVETAPLLRLSLAKLQSNDNEESSRFFEASKDLGFFYLDLQGNELGQSLLHEADALFNLSEELFGENLDPYDMGRQRSYYGYKRFGMAVVDKHGTPDSNEFYNISKDDMLAVSEPLPAPQMITKNRPLLASYMKNSHAIVTILLEHLDKHLKLSPDTLPSLHKLLSPSGDQIRFVKAPPQPANDRKVSLGAHTDFGSLTVLFNRLGGLQVLPPGHEEWLYVRPLAGHAIINLGDALTKFSNGLLRSNMHRVVAPPGRQAKYTRYSVVYFARPEDHVLLRRLDSHVIPPLARKEEAEEVVTAKEWTLRRAMARRIGADTKATALEFESRVKS